MADVTLSGALITAAIAAGTTVVIEFAAKPYLEVRKERILQQHRERQELARRLLVIETNLADASLKSLRGPDPVLTTLQNASDQLSSERVLLEDHLPAVLRKLINYQLGYVAALIEASSLVYRRSIESDEAEELEALITKILGGYRNSWSTLPAHYLRTPRHHWIRRWKIRRQAREELKRREKKGSSEEVAGSPLAEFEPDSVARRVVDELQSRVDRKDLA